MIDRVRGKEAAAVAKAASRPGGALERYRHKIRPLSILWKILRFGIVFGVCFIVLFPIFKKLSVAFMSEVDLFDATVVYIPRHLTLDNFRVAWDLMHYAGTFLRTFLLSFGSSILQLAACLLVAYGFARFRFPLKKLWFALVIFTMIIPPQVIMLPLYMQFRYVDFFGVITALRGEPFNTLDTPLPMLLLSITASGFKNGLYIYLLRQYFMGFPRELEEAAYIDGAGRLRTFLRIMVPSAIPMMVTVFLFGFVWQWTDSFYSGLYMPSMQFMSSVLSQLPENLKGVYGSAGGSMGFLSPGYISMISNTGVLLCIFPLVVVYLLLQRTFMESIARSGIVG